MISIKCGVVSLLEANLNLILKIKFSKHDMQSIKDHLSGSLQADNQNGFCPNQRTDQVVLGNRVSIDIAHQHCTPFATLETDCKSAFNCCDPNLTVIAHLRLGVPEILSNFMLGHLHCTTFNIRAGGMTLTTLMTFQISQTCASDLQLFHQTFQAFQVTMLADIVYASRKYIHMSSFQCIGITLSLYRWPICKYNITSNHTEIWQLVLH